MQHYLRKNSLVRPFCKESSISFASFGPTLWRVHHFLSHTKAKRSVRARCAKTTPPPPPVLSAKQKTTLSLFRRLAFFLRVGVGAFKTIYIYIMKQNEMKWNDVVFDDDAARRHATSKHDKRPSRRWENTTAVVFLLLGFDERSRDPADGRRGGRCDAALLSDDDDVF